MILLKNLWRRFTLTVNVRLSFISEDVWYIRLTNGQQFFQPLEWYQQLTDQDLELLIETDQDCILYL